MDLLSLVGEDGDGGMISWFTLKLNIYFYVSGIWLIIGKIAPKSRNTCPIRRLVASLKALVCLLLLHMDGWQIRGWDHIRKFIPLDWLVIFRRPHSRHNAAAPDAQN